ncbi:hypothetical protein ACHAXM_005805 [Skeletonema potamos]
MMKMLLSTSTCPGQQSKYFLLRRRGNGLSLTSDDGKKKSKKKTGKQPASSSLNFKSSKSSTMIGGASAIVLFVCLSFPFRNYLKRTPRHSHFQHSASDSAHSSIYMERSTSLRSRRRDDKNEKDGSCHRLPSIYWINLEKSKERRNALVKAMKKTGVVNERRVAASGAKEASDLIKSKQLIFHPEIKIQRGNGEPSFKKHPENIYTYNEAACLLSHLKAIKQAYDDGRETALIVEDDALLSGVFCDEFDAYVAQAPVGWKVLQLATNNPHVVMQGSLMHEPFISWQRYHHSSRAYLINRSGMETLLGKVHSTTLTGESVWSVQEFPSVVADEAIYTFIGDTYYSTGLWIDTSQLDSTIQKHQAKGRWADPYSIVAGKEREQVAMKSQISPAHLFDRSLLVVMNVRIVNEDQIAREIEVITQDIHAVCKFHRVCEWMINVVATDPFLRLFQEAASGLPSYVHLHTKLYSKNFNKFLFVEDVLSRLAQFDLMLLKDNDQRINGFPWRTFVEHTNNAVLSAPLRSTQKDHMLWSTLKEKSQDVQFHDANYWLLWYNGRDWHQRLIAKFRSIESVDVPFLETYFVLLDARFAKHLFQRVFASGLLDDSSRWGKVEYLWCQAAFDWDSRRPSCKLIPLVSTHEDSLNVIKRDDIISHDTKEIAFQSPRKNPDPNFGRWMSLAMEWEAIVGEQHTVIEIEQLCLKKMNIAFVDEDDDEAYENIPDTDISVCARTILEENSLSPGGNELFSSLALVATHEAKEPKSSAETERAAATTTPTTPKLEFVHITKTGGSAIEHAGAKEGINWGACHYMVLPEVGCSSPDLPYEAPDYRSYALTSPWHTPPKHFKTYVEDALSPYNDADLFAVVRNPYSRVLSEYYCPWNGFQAKYRPATQYEDEEDPNDPKVMNKWVKSMVKRLASAIDEFNETKEYDKHKVKKQAKGLNEDEQILAPKHYINQAEYVFDGDEIIVKNVVHYENLSTEFDALMKKYGIDVNLPSKQDGGVYSDENKGRLSHLHLDPEAIALVNEFAKPDFEKFGYQMVEMKFDEHYSLEATIITDVTEVAESSR